MEALSELRQLRNLAKERGDVQSQVRCGVAEVLIAALEDSRDFDEICNRYTAYFPSLADLDDGVWTVVNVARNIHAETTNSIDPAVWNTPEIRNRMVLALQYIAKNPGNLSLPVRVILRLPEAVNHALDWFCEVWSNDALLADRPLEQVVDPVLFAASFYATLDEE
jgi:hypothetical protein